MFIFVPNVFIFVPNMFRFAPHVFVLCAAVKRDKPFAFMIVTMITASPPAGELHPVWCGQPPGQEPCRVLPHHTGRGAGAGRPRSGGWGGSTGLMGQQGGHLD